MGAATTPTPFEDDELPEQKPKKARKPRAGVRNLRPRQSSLTDELWTALKGMYEAGGYSQKDLVSFAQKRGANISQSRISRRAQQEGWVKGEIRKEIQEQVYQEVRDALGENLRKMLEQHGQQSRALLIENLRHLAVAEEKRKVDPSYLIPAALLRQITSAVKEAQEMEARAAGFNYREGKPFRMDEDEGDKLQSFDVRVMTEEEQRDVAEKMERQASGEDE